MNKKTAGRLLMILGFVMLITATVIYAGFDRVDNQAGETAEVIREALDDARESDRASESAEYVPAAAGEMPQKTLMGYALIGNITIPSVGIDLPVLNDWSYDLLKISPCRYSGSIEDGNLIILGHNYKSHFTPLKKVKVGDSVRFTDVNGFEYKYYVDKTETLHKTQLDELTMTGYDLTLFTCTADGQSRFAARCTRAD